MSAPIRTAKTRPLKTKFTGAHINARKIWALTNQSTGVKEQQSIDDLIMQSFSSDTVYIVSGLNHFFTPFLWESKDDNVASTNLQESSIASAFFTSIDEHYLRSFIFSLNSSK